MRELSVCRVRTLLHRKALALEGVLQFPATVVTSSVPRPTNLHRRPSGIYYARIHIPTDLVQVIGKKDKWVSLRTNDPEEAKRRLIAVQDEWATTFEDLRRERELTETDFAVAVHEHFSTKVMEGDRERAARPTPDEVMAAFDAAVEKGRKERLGANAFDMINIMTDVEILAGKSRWAADRRTRRLARLRHDLGLGDTRLIEPEVDAFLSGKHVRIVRGSLQYRELCQRLMRAEIQQLEIYAQRDRGDFGAKPTDDIIEAAAEVVERLSAAGTAQLGPARGIMDLFSNYERERVARPESTLQAKRDVQHFVDFLGAGAGPTKMTRAAVRDWKEVLMDYPVRASDTNIFRGLAAREIVALNKTLKEPKPTLAHQTIRRAMGSLNGFCTWLVNNDYLESNPVAGLIPEKAPPTNKRSSLDHEALALLFQSPLFTTARSDQWRHLHEVGNIAVRDHRYWIPWIMLYSGARPGEIAQLYVDDIRLERNIWVMQIVDEEGTGKRVKRGSSRRVVPIHSRLIAMGFLVHVERQRAAGKAQVFPEVEIPKEGQIAAQFSREFNRYLANVGVKKDRRIVAYSLRHTFIDEARKAEHLDDAIAIIVGHETGNSKKTMTSGYGAEQHGTLEWRQRLVESVRYPSLERPPA
ncbi:tyrosine-type recombinase/integrase [Devosia sp. ZB163]|uniref:DUF6538 domain-containing protein n=1 Tax=Devosia sp. ZB163 TaxID=3025938 RepID=UPI00235E7D6F|nr:DUF6538 domain-containing protein [Devosia sp. ZB163]MDC9823970.1 tyrosine-type recombinase/integrase [Devosia sp. ZB163]